MRARFGGSRLKWLAAILLAFPLLALAGGHVWWTRGLPLTQGTMRLPGLSQETRAIRDAYGVPHIFAATMHDAMRVLGYVHAQDRMFQMDITRRVGQGRLAAVIGPDGVRFDRLFRTLDIAGAAAKSLSALSADARAQLDAYASGVNAWLAERHPLPIEYTLLGFAPEPWKPEDSLLWGKAMAWKLSANWRQDALRGRLAQRFEMSRLERLFPKPFPEWPITTDPRLAASARRADAASPGAAMPMPASRPEAARAAAIDFAQMLALPSIGQGASNEWVVDGSRSASGKPLLANDPHLELGAPILWYLARITTPELTLAGATAPGAPLVLLGQNQHIAWGFTTTESDTQDLFVETLVPERPDHYLTPDGPRPLRLEQVDIAVKGAPTVTFVRRVTRHGPVVSDIIEDLAGKNEVISLAWTGLGETDTTAEALFRINGAADTEALMAALRLYHTPTQNIAFASADGTIGFINVGDVPVRKSGDGRYPVSGATGEGDWTGLVPFEDWPQLRNPQAGAIVNANNMVARLDYPHWLGYDQGPGFRAGRILELLGQRQHHDIASFAAIQMDSQAAHARELVPFLLRAPASTALAAKALELMSKWDFRAAHDRPEALILDWWLYRLNAHLLREGLDKDVQPLGGLNAAAVIDVLRHPDGFCGGAAGKDCSGAIAAAFAQTLADLSARHGDDVTRWRWGEEHRAMIANQVMDRVPGFKALFGLDFPSDGGFYSVNRGGNPGQGEASHPLARNSGAGYRGIYDLADPARSRFIVATGQSGHPLSPHYNDQFPLWRRGEGIPLHVGESELMARNTGVLIFQP